MEKSNSFEDPASALVMILYIAAVLIVFIGIYYLYQEATLIGLSVFGVSIFSWFMAEVLKCLSRIADASEYRTSRRSSAPANQGKNTADDGSYSLD